jgi:class 3 adenylate cyclase
MMQLSSTLSWLVDAACETQGADRFLADLGTRLIADSVPLAGGALGLAVPHPLIARRTWLWRAENGEVMEALGFVPGGLGDLGQASPPGDAGRRWLAGLAAGPVHEDAVGARPGGPSLSWIGPRPFTPDDADRLRQAARFAAAPLAALTARATLRTALEAYLGRRSATRLLSGPLRRNIGETIQAALLFADLRGFTALSENNPPSTVIAALDAWFDRIGGSVHAFGGEVLKFIGDGVLAIFPVGEASHHLVGDRGRDIGERECLLLLGHARVIDHLEQEIAELVGQGSEIVPSDRVGNLVRLLDGVRRDGCEALFPVPGAARLRRAQRGHDVEQAAKLGLGGRAHGPSAPNGIARA